MDRNTQTPESTPRFNWRRAGIAMLAAVAVIPAGSWIVRTYPNSGYQAGYEATTVEGEERIRAKVEAAGVTAKAVCDEIHDQADQSPSEPRYERDSFIRGCSEAVDRLYGRHVPLVSASD